MLSARVASWLQVRPDEGRRVALTTAMMLIPGAGIAIGVSGAESLLLSRVGAESLPRLYIVLGLITIFTTLAITALLGRISALRFYLALPIAVAVLLVGARFLVPLGHDWVYEGLWMGASLFHTLLQIMLWGVAGMTWDTRQAKRLYPLFAAADIAGFSAGGLVTPLLVTWLGTANLLLIWVMTMLLAYGLALRLVAAAPETSIGTGAQPRARRVKRNVIGDLLAGFQYVLRSRLLFWIAVTAVLFQGLVYLLWFLFSSAVELQFPNEDDLTGFLGGFRGATTGIALLSSLLLATRINARFGLAASFVILAIFDVIGFSVLVVAGSFFAVVGLRFVHEVWQSGVARNAWQALFNVVPLVRREQTRLFINGVCLQVGAMLIGALLLLAKNTDATLGAYLVGVAAAVLALFAAWRVRQAYVGALLEALRAGRPLVFQSEADPFAVFERDPAESAIAVSRLSDPDVAVRRAASDILADLADAEMVPTLVKGLEDADAQVRANILRALARLQAPAAQDDIIARLKDPDPEVQTQAILAFRRLVSDPDVLGRHLRPLLGGEEPAVRAESAATLLKLGSQPEALAALQEMARSDDIDTRVEAVNGFADWADRSALAPVVTALDDSQPAVRRAAVGALAQIGGPESLNALLPILGDKDWSVCEAAAASIGMFGEDALDVVVAALSDPQLESGAIQALTHLPVASKADVIRDRVRERIELALRYDGRWKSVHAWAQEDESAELLADSLKRVAERHGINALQLLGTLANREAYEAAIASLDSRDRGQSANAIEILDSVSDRLMVRPLLRLWEPEHEGTHFNNTGSLLQSLRDPDPWVRACAALAARSISAELAALASEDPDDNVREVAANALKGDQSMEKMKSLSMMERILFLKGVPLFAELAPPELKQVASITEERLFDDEEMLAEQDEQGDELFIIVTGEVQVLVKSGEGMKELARRKSGEHVGEMAIISQAPRTARLVAVGPVRALCIGQKPFEVILRERPETSMAVMRELCERLRVRASEAGRPPAGS